MKISAPLLIALGVGAYFLMKNANATPTAGASYGAGSAVKASYEPSGNKVDVNEPAYTPAQMNTLMAEAVNLYKAATENKNVVEQQRAVGMAALASGSPIGVSAETAKFITSATGGSTATDTPSNYIQTGGALRYVGPTNIAGAPI